MNKTQLASGRLQQKLENVKETVGHEGAVYISAELLCFYYRKFQR